MRTALLVDDDPIVACLTQTLLERAGWEIDWAKTGRQAIEALASRRYWLVLLDLGLPDIDGAGVVSWLRHFEREHDHTRTHVFVVTATSTARVAELDVDAVLQKPVRMAAVEEALQRIDMAEPIDFADLNLRAGSDHLLVCEILDDFVTMVARDRVSLGEACRERSMHETSRLAHRLRGSLLAIGAGGAAHRALRLEEVAHQKREDEVDDAYHRFESALDDTITAIQRFLAAT